MVHAQAKINDSKAVSLAAYRFVEAACILDIATDDASTFCNPVDLAQVFSEEQERDLLQWRPVCHLRFQQISLAWVGGNRIGQKGTFKSRDYLAGETIVLRHYEHCKDGSPKIARATKLDSERAHDYVSQHRSPEDVKEGKHVLPFPSAAGRSRTVLFANTPRLTVRAQRRVHVGACG